MIGNIDFFGGLRALANETNGTATDYYSQPFDISGGVSGSVELVVKALFAGTGGTLDVTIEHSNDQVNWTTLATFTQASGATSETETLSGMYRYARAKASFDGTSAVVTFTLKGVIRAS